MQLYSYTKDSLINQNTNENNEDYKKRESSDRLIIQHKKSLK